MSNAFVDYQKVHVKAGHGGAGCVAFRREKYVPHGGPAGGDGGRGGHVIFEASERLATLLDLKLRPNLTADNGRPGQGNKCYGSDGEDIVIEVPLGVVVTDEEGRQLADLTKNGQRWIAASGGRGGLGNSHFATPTNKTPRYAQPGEEGEERDLILELKVIADVGLVGLPNAGKSTLLAKLTHATPKIAPYPFTTLSPNLGVIEFDDLRHITIADVPGLIEGAHTGVGLGDRFLRHIERTKILLHLVGDESGAFDPDDMVYKYELVNAELQTYSRSLADKPHTVVITKIDLAKDEDIEKTRKAFRERLGIEVMTVSAHDGRGLDELRRHMRRSVEDNEREIELEQ